MIEYYPKGLIVYVEPGIGYGQVWDRIDENKLEVLLFDSMLYVQAEEDNVFKIHGEHYYDRMESLTGKLMDAAGNYEMPYDIEKILSDINNLVNIYAMALKNGQK